MHDQRLLADGRQPHSGQRIPLSVWSSSSGRSAA
jgi:hypothetical protein